MFKKLSSVFSRSGRTKANTSISLSTLKPDEAFFAVGDVHGCLPQLHDLLSQIEEKRAAEEPIIILGDMVDRGVQSAQVLEYIFERSLSDADSVIPLMGNHERMLVEFIDDPAGKGASWLVHGGKQTLESFGITGVNKQPDAEDAMDAANALEKAMIPGMQDWLRSLPLSWASGNIHCVHAAMHPERPPHKQDDRILLWGHPKFMNTPRGDDFHIVHGHTIVPDPVVEHNRISIDTGAYTGRPLTGAHITAGHVSFLQA